MVYMAAGVVEEAAAEVFADRFYEQVKRSK